MFESTPAVKTIFYINVMAFLLTLLIPGIMESLFAFSNIYYPWQLITYQFMHGGVMHIFFNMIVLVSFGPYVEQVYGARKFWIYYLLCGVIGAFLQYFMTLYTDMPNIPLVGASAAIWGIMTLFTLLNPNGSMYLFFIPIAIKAKYLIGTLFIIEIFSAIYLSDSVGHYAHIGGAITGGLIFLFSKFNRIFDQVYKLKLK